MIEELISRCDQRYVKKVYKMVDLCTRSKQEQDAVLIIEGREGTGKTNSAVFTAAIVKKIAGRDIYLYFSLDKLILKAQNTTGKVFIWDEPALDSLTTDSLNKRNKNLMRLLMMCRANRHFFIINLVDFTKFHPFITVERPVGFVHLFKLRPGHGCYIRYKKLEALRDYYLREHKRKYAKLKSFYFDCPLVGEDDFNNLDLVVNGIEHATFKDYQSEKRKAISSIGQEDMDKKKEKAIVKWLKWKIATEPKGLKTLAERAAHYKVTERNLQRWAKLGLTFENAEEIGEGAVFEADDDANIVNLGQREGGGDPPIPKGAYDGL